MEMISKIVCFHTHTTSPTVKRLAFVLFAAIFINSNTAFSQVNPEWKTHGNTADSSAFIGTTNDACLRFRSNNVERMRISHDGKVGIGVDNPVEKLDVDGDFLLRGDVIVKNYVDQQDSSLRLLLIDEEGRTRNMSKSLFKAYSSWEDCFEIHEGVTLPGQSGPINIVAGSYSDWGKRIEGSKSILYTGSDCPAWVGIGTNLPMTKLRSEEHRLNSSHVRISYAVFCLKKKI